MTGRVLHTPIMLISVMMLALNGQALGAQEVESPQEALARALGPRPEIRNYTRQDRFVTDLLAWQRHKSELEAKLARGESITPPAPAPQPNWHHVTGPEDLDTAAVRRATSSPTTRAYSLRPHHHPVFRCRHCRNNSCQKRY